MRRRMGERGRPRVEARALEDRVRSGGLALLALLACLTVAGCTPPVVFTVATAKPAYDVHRCVTESLVQSGFRVVESRRDDGIVKAERQGDFLWFPDPKELDIIDVVIYEREDGQTGIQYTAGRLLLDEEPRLEGPEPEVEAIAEGIADDCSD
jgi:hypothetical protein